MTNGALYLIEPRDLRRQGSFYSEAIIDDPAECNAIDSEWYWRMAQALLYERPLVYEISSRAVMRRCRVAAIVLAEIQEPATRRTQSGDYPLEFVLKKTFNESTVIM